MFPRAILSSMVLMAAAVSAQDRSELRNLGQADANKDGNISRAEYLEARGQQFAKLDRNADGYIDDADQTTRTEGQPQRARRTAQLRKQLDTNGDGKVSKAEFVDAPAPLFDRADTDRDGILSAEEIDAVRGKVRQRAGRTRPDQAP